MITSFHHGSSYFMPACVLRVSWEVKVSKSTGYLNSFESHWHSRKKRELLGLCTIDGVQGLSILRKGSAEKHGRPLLELAPYDSELEVTNNLSK